MSLGKKLFIGRDAACTTDTADKFGDSSGIALYSLDYDASDASGNYDGTPSNVTFGIDGEINWGASFNGSSSEIQFTTDSNFVNDFTISAWINMNQLPASSYLYQVVAWGDEAVGERRSLGIWNGGSGDPKVYFSGFGSAANFGGSTSVSANQWYHICVTRSGSTVKVYLNGNLDGTGTVTLNSYTGTTGKIGNSGSANEHFNGVIDQVRIFDRAISPTEVSALYAETACVYTSTTDNNDYPISNVAYYKLDNNADDAKGNYDGTATNVNYEFGRFGQAAVFNGSSSIIKDVLGSGFTYAGKTMTFSAWIFVEDASNDNMIIGDGLATSTGGWGISTGYGGAPNRRLSFSVASTAMGGVQQTYSSVSVSDNTWTHIVVSVDFSSITDSVKMYINGTEDTSLTDGITGTFVDNTTYNTAIGATWTGSAGRLFEGKIDQVRIYNSALDATAVENLYNEKPEAQPNFNAVLYNGTGSSGNYVSNVGFYPDLVWLKSRDGSASHKLFDIVRGDTDVLESNSNLSSGVTSQMRGFEGNGFILDGTASAYNGSNINYVAWCWKGGGDAVSNTYGNITSQVSANPDAGFSIVGGTGSTYFGGSLGHGLSQAPELIIYKDYTVTNAWFVYHKDLTIPNNYYLHLDQTAAEANYGQNVWDVTSTTFSTDLGVDRPGIAYCFHSVTGYQKIGSFTYSAGVSVNVGFAPQFVMFKKTSAAGSWTIVDNKRFSGTTDYGLFANLNAAEVTSTDYLNLTSTGFTTTYSDTGTFIYLAIA